MSTTTVRLVECEYDCECGQIHRYTEGTDYDLHGDMRIGNKRWIYQEAEGRELW